jgi:hypothetical protein
VCVELSRRSWWETVWACSVNRKTRMCVEADLERLLRGVESFG